MPVFLCAKVWDENRRFDHKSCEASFCGKLWAKPKDPKGETAAHFALAKARQRVQSHLEHQKQAAACTALKGCRPCAIAFGIALSRLFLKPTWVDETKKK